MELVKKGVRMRKVVEEWKEKRDAPVIVTIHCQGCQQIQMMSSNPAAKCFYHTEKISLVIIFESVSVILVEENK